MTARRWHILREGTSLTLARHLPARFDIGVVSEFEKMGKLRLAQQVRQDMWRALRDVRGFSPVVHVEEHDHGLRLRAGGRVEGPAPRAGLEITIASVLACPRNRARWAAFAGRRA
ncbi:hypothetical protein [Nioella aestuarii]|uniref:hypothetical protein n=1 Tax=Nioella aestuarii TaxID=1662864 RepID=UPI003D7FBAB7